MATRRTRGALSERVFGEFLELFAWKKKVRLGSL